MIEAKNLTKDYGTIRAASNVSFTVEKGDILGFLGPNGAGKSTTMKMLTGFIPPTEGTGAIGGHDIKEAPLEAKKLFGYLPESGPLYQEMTVEEFLSFIADMRGYTDKESKEKVMTRALTVCHLLSVRHQTIDTLSKGYRQRVGLAQAILHDPPCLVLDEPTDGLDPNQKREVRKLISSMSKDKAIILSTHILEEVDAMCNRIIIIAKGKVIVDSTPAKLKEEHNGKSLEDIFCELTTFDD
jgi:ABC-2 type transport system ATP-binding protein